MSTRSKGQRLVISEIDKRVVVKLDKSIKKTNDGVNGLMIFGEKNDYPQIMERLINGSVTAKAAASMYSRFLVGQGFENEAINDIVVGKDPRGKDITIRSLLGQVGDSISKNNGFDIHCNQTRDRRVKNVHLKSFKTCRFAKPDDTGYSAMILTHDNWEKDRDSIPYKKEDIREYNVFNLEQNAFEAQVKKAGGIEKFKGQIYFQFLDNEYFYPLSPFDPSYLDCDTENEIGLFKNRQIRNGFLDKIIMRVPLSGTEEEKEDFVAGVKKQLGPDGDSVLVFEDDVDDVTGEVQDSGSFKVDHIKTNVNPKLFDTWEKGLANNIRKAVRGIPALLIDYEESSLGTTSGEALIQATNYYNALTSDDRTTISKSFKEIFSNFVNDELANNTNWNIKPLSLIEIATEEAVDASEIARLESQATLKGSVGGVTALLQLQQSVSDGTTDLEAAVSIVMEIYGFDEGTARKMIGTPKNITEDGSTTE